MSTVPIHPNCCGEALAKCDSAIAATSVGFAQAAIESQSMGYCQGHGRFCAIRTSETCM